MKRYLERIVRPLGEYERPKLERWDTFFGLIHYYIQGLFVFFLVYSLYNFVFGSLSIITSQMTSTLITKFTEGTLAKTELLWMIGFCVLVIVSFFAWSIYIRPRFMNAQQVRLAQMREELVEHLLDHKRPYHQKFNQGTLISRVVSDTDHAYFNVQNFITWFPRTSFTYLAIMVLLLYHFGWGIFLCTLGITALTGLIGQWMAMYLEPVYDEIVDAKDVLSERLREYVEGMNEVRGFGMEDYIEDQQEVLSETYLQKNYIVTLLEHLMWHGVFALIFILTLANLFLYQWMVQTHGGSAGDIFFLIVACSYIEAPMWGLIYVTVEIRGGRVMARRIHNLLETTDGLHYGSEQLSQFEKAEFLHYSYAFPGEAQKEVLHDICATVKRGDFICLVGETGSGKSVLLEQLCRLNAVGTGHVLINDIPIFEYCRHGLEQKITYVSQNVSFLSDTIANNLRMVKPNASDEELMDVLDQASFFFNESLPDGLNTLIGQRGITLSGGQKKRLALAQVFLGDADLLLLDDVLSAVDNVTEQRILRSLKKLQEKGEKTILLSTHRLDVTKFCDCIWVMEKGEIVAKGDYDTLCESNEVFRRLIQEQREEETDEDTVETVASE